MHRRTYVGGLCPVVACCRLMMMHTKKLLLANLIPLNILYQSTEEWGFSSSIARSKFSSRFQTLSAVRRRRGLHRQTNNTTLNQVLMKPQIKYDEHLRK